MQIYRILTQDMPVPNVIVYLTASLETLQNESPCAEENLKKHGSKLLTTAHKDYETAMDAFKKIIRKYQY